MDDDVGIDLSIACETLSNVEGDIGAQTFDGWKSAAADAARDELNGIRLSIARSLDSLASARVVHSIAHTASHEAQQRAIVSGDLRAIGWGFLHPGW
ncbi:hypothetical protein G7Y41_00470 [Schaalia sp. ZJ405]|uniref:hypothetical protein n=1 Tax=Schaalia sp. ZJ405 TaxID=2709403 RepID=UPI0013E9AAD3|nr:hypothetical protein [Schaalia sp. ZJ405]QPK81395.1 hypothetical protein G7Y41_00470 [Schaalia sp. ZJ405]